MNKKSGGGIVRSGFSICLLLLLASCANPSTAGTQPAVGNNQGNSPPTKPLKTAAAVSGAPLGSEAAADDMSIVVTEVVSPADRIVAAGNKHNATLEPNSLFIMVNVTVTCKKAAAEKCLLVGNEFKVIDSAGVFHRHVYTVGVDGIFLPGEFKGGDALKGYLIFQVPIGDKKLILRYAGNNTGGEANLALY